MAEKSQGSGSGRGQSSSSGSGKQSSGKSEAQGKTDQALKDERSSSSGSSSSGGGGDVQQDTLGSEPSQEEMQQRDDATAATGEDTPGVERDPSGVLAPAENAPGPEPVEAPTLTAVDLRARIEPKDRATYLGAVHRRNEDVDVPEEFQLFGDSDGERDAETVELDGKPVDVFQVIGTNGNLAFRFDGDTYVLDAEQARAFSMDMQGVLTNVVT